MYESLKNEIIHCGILLDRYGLITLSGGNIGVRADKNVFIITPSGMIYEDMVTDDCVVVNEQGDVIEGFKKPSVDTKALLHVLNSRADIHAVIHTHQPYATAIGLIQDEFPCVLTSIANAAKGDVKVCPYVSPATEEVGTVASEYLKDRDVVILKNHGLISVGKDLKTALSAATYTEEAAKTYILARSISNNVATLNEEQIIDSIAVLNRYGQK